MTAGGGGQPGHHAPTDGTFLKAESMDDCFGLVGVATISDALPFAYASAYAPPPWRCAKGARRCVVGHVGCGPVEGRIINRNHRRLHIFNVHGYAPHAHRSGALLAARPLRPRRIALRNPQPPHVVVRTRHAHHFSRCGSYPCTDSLRTGHSTPTHAAPQSRPRSSTRAVQGELCQSSHSSLSCLLSRVARGLSKSAPVRAV